MAAGFASGGSGALVGALTGGISGGVQYQRQNYVFRKGLADLGMDGGGAVPATDKFLSDAQKAWYKNAPMDKIDAFTVENVPKSAQIAMDNNNAAAATQPIYKKISRILTGRSNVYLSSFTTLLMVTPPVHLCSGT